MPRVGVVTHPDPDLTAYYFVESLKGLSSGFGPGVPLLFNPGAAADVDGWIYLGPSSADRLADVPKPVVAVNGRVPGVPSVDSDNAGAAEAAVAHLLGAGRRRVAVVNGKLYTDNGRDRFAGYRRALEKAGLPVVPALVAEGDFSAAAGAAAVKAFAAAGASYDALFAANDQMALGAMAALQAAGRRVPEDVAVVGFDDMPEAAKARPPLSTVRQPFAEMARRGARLLAGWLDGRPPARDAYEQVDAPLVVRASCGGTTVTL